MRKNFKLAIVKGKGNFAQEEIKKYF